MQQRSDVITAESLAIYSTWSDGRLLLAALQELPFSARAEMDEALVEHEISRIDELSVADVESRFDVISSLLLGRLRVWRSDLTERLHEAVCIKADYCNNRNSQDFAFWSDLILVVAGILGDLGFLTLSLVLIRRLFDQLCGCQG